MVSPHINVPFGSIGDHIRFIRKNRLNLEIFMNAGDLDGLTPRDIDGLKDLLDYGPSLTLHAPFMDLSPGAVDSRIRQVTRERFTQIFDVAEALRPLAVVVHSGYEKWKYAHRVEAWLEGSLELWSGFMGRAASMGTKIAVENIFEDETRSLRMLMEELDSPHAGICFDTGHFHIFSKSPLADWMQSIGQYIVELHLHDNNGDYDSHLAIGEGGFDFQGLFRALGGRDDIIYTIEARSEEDVQKSMERLASLVRAFPPGSSF